MSRTVDYLPVGCLGKLPFEREHLRVNLSVPSARSLDKWIHDGRHEMLLTGGDNGTSDLRSVEIAEWRFAINDESADALLVGIVRPSMDLERRTYPFALFALVPRSLYGRHYAFLPLGLEPVWDGIEDIWRVLASSVTRAAFTEVISDASAPAPLPASEAKARYEGSISDSAGRLFERTDDTSLSALSESWAELLKTLKKNTGRGEIGPRLGFPVSKTLGEAAYDASFWLDLLNRQFLLKRLEPSVFIDASAGPADRNVLMVFGSLTPDDYPGIMGGAPPRTEIQWPARGGKGADASAAPPPPLPTFGELLSRKFTAQT